MATMTGTIRNGRIELDEPADLPEGTRVYVSEAEPEPDAEFINEANWPDTPENRAELVRRIESFEGLGWTLDEEARIAAAREVWKRFNIEAVRKQMGLDQ